MEIANKFYNALNTPSLSNTIMLANSHLAENLNCIRIGIVDSVYSDMTVSVKLANKKTLKQNHDGTQTVREYALIRAKVCYCTPFATWDIKKGDECVLLFSDREIESWFTTGEVSPIAYPRMHDLTDAVAIFGIRSLPNVFNVSNGLNLFYGANSINITNTDIQATNFKALNGATGSFVSQDNKTVTVTNGIITSIS